MTKPIILDFDTAKIFLGDDLNNFTSTIAYDNDNNYSYYVVSFRLPKKFIGLKSADEIYHHQKLSHQMMFGNIEAAPNDIEFNFECKCRAEKGRFEIIIFKPWCKETSLDLKAINAIESIFFLCLDIRLFTALLKKSLQKGDITFDDFSKTRVLNELDKNNFWSFSLGDQMFDISDNSNPPTSLYLSKQFLSYSFEEQIKYIIDKGFTDCLADNSDLSFKYLNKTGISFPLSSFVAEAKKGMDIFAYLILFNVQYLYPKEFGIGYYIDIFLKERSDIILLKRYFEKMISFLGQGTTVINLYLDNHDDKFGYLLYEPKGFTFSEKQNGIIEIEISKPYYKDLLNSFELQDFSDFNFYGDPYEHPQIFKR